MNRRCGRGLVLPAGLLVTALLSSGCYTSQLGLLRSGLDSLRVQLDTLTVRDSVAYRVLAETRHDLAQQKDILLSTRATTGSTTQELFDQMSRLEGKLDESMHRFENMAERVGVGAPAGVTAPPPSADTAAAGQPGPGTPSAGPGPPANASPAGGAPTAAQAYDLATRDLTEGRYPLALQGYRGVLGRFADSPLAPGAQFGVAECFFAQSQFDSAAVGYAGVGQRWPRSDRVPASLYKLALCQERLGRAAESRQTFQDLIRRFPSSSEAGLARDRIGGSRH